MDCKILKFILVPDFCPLKTEIVMGGKKVVMIPMGHCTIPRLEVKTIYYIYILMKYQDFSFY